jgi:hypothetical protein
MSDKDESNEAPGRAGAPPTEQIGLNAEIRLEIREEVEKRVAHQVAAVEHHYKRQ